MRTCERCCVSFDLNSPSGLYCYHQSFFKLTVPKQHVTKIVGYRGKIVQEIKKTSEVSHIHITQQGTGLFKGEVQLQGKSDGIENAFSQIRSRLRVYHKFTSHGLAARTVEPNPRDALKQQSTFQMTAIWTSPRFRLHEAWQEKKCLERFRPLTVRW